MGWVGLVVMGSETATRGMEGIECKDEGEGKGEVESCSGEVVGEVVGE